MLYLVDKSRADVAFRTISGDDDPHVVLLQDGVLLEPDLDAPTYAVERDLQLRGVEPASDVEPISYDALVELVFEHEVRSFV